MVASPDLKSIRKLRLIGPSSVVDDAMHGDGLVRPIPASEDLDQDTGIDKHNSFPVLEPTDGGVSARIDEGD